MRIAIIGAGPAGLAAAFDFLKEHHEVVCYESSSQVGGLASGFKAPHWEWSVDRYYHHWFQSDSEILRLADDLGIRDKVLFPQPVTALYHEGKFYPFDSPLAVLRFPGIPFIDRLRFGFAGAYLRFSRNWQSFEKYSAHDWLLKALGKRAYEVLWEPMLEGKFGKDYYREVNMAWFWARIHARTRCLGTFEGGIQAYFEILAERIRTMGGQIHLKTPVHAIHPVGDAKIEVESAGRIEAFDRVLCTSAPEILSQLVPELPADYLAGVKNLKSLAAVVLTLALDRPLGQGVYWYNLPKKAGFPFLCLVEHTCYVPPEHFGGDHIVYCGDYVPVDHRYMSMNKEEIMKEFLPALKKINPAIEPSWVRDAWLFKTPYAQPIPFKNHSRNIPSIKTPVPGLYWASMSHVYPWDRGTNFAVEMGRKTAQMIMNE